MHDMNEKHLFGLDMSAYTYYELSAEIGQILIFLTLFKAIYNIPTVPKNMF